MVNAKDVKFKNFKRKIKSPFMIYAKYSHTNKYQKHVACSYDYQLVCVDDKFSKRFKSYLAEDAVYYFIGSMMKESKYCSDVMKKTI